MRIIILVLPLIAVFNGCQKENAVPRDYPRVKDTEVRSISDSGAVFSADLYSLGTETSKEHGFVWGTYKGLDINMNNRVDLGIVKKTGIFTAAVMSALKKGTLYYVKPFVKTDNRVVYGPDVSFESLGGKAPVITRIEPSTAGWGDTIMIRGKYFSWIPYTNLVKLNQVICPVLRSTDTTIFIQIATLISTIKNLVSVELAGNISVLKGDTFRLKPPVFRDFLPKSGYWTDTIKITGDYLKYFSSNYSDYIKFGTISAPRIRNLGDTLWIKIPNELSAVSSILRISIGGFLLDRPVPFTLDQPFFTFSPISGHWNQVVTLTGRFDPLLARNKVYFNNTQANIVSVSEHQMVVSVPQALPDVKSIIKYVVDPFTVVSQDTFRIYSPLINSFTPSTGPTGTSVTIRGKYFNSLSSKVYFDAVQASVTSINDSIIIASVPSGINGPVKISVKVYSQSVISLDDFIVTNPVINTISPLTGTFNDQVTITGENLIPPSGSTTVSFGGISASVLSITANQIITKVPVQCDSIPKVISVKAGINNTNSADKFILDPISVESVSSSGFSPGTDFIISGHNFNPTAVYNTVFWDIYPLVIKSVTPTEIIATWPYMLPRGNNRLKVTTSGYKRYSTESFASNSQWLRIAAPNILTNYVTAYYYGIANYSAGLKNYGYVASAAMEKLFRFDPSDNSWTEMPAKYPYPNWYYHWGAGSTVLQDTMYIIQGNGSNINFIKAFTPGSSNWRTYNSSGGSYVLAFALNNKIYYGLDLRFSDRNYFWESNPSNNYISVRKGDFPTLLPANFSGYFSLKDKGYVVFGNNQVWEFDPDLLQWSRKSDFPGPARIFSISFVIGDYAYFGTGQSYSNTEYDDIWKYDPSGDTWTSVTRMPNARFSATAFVLNGKAYIGFGLNRNGYSPGDYFDFYEFDPNYPVK